MLYPVPSWIRSAIGVVSLAVAATVVGAIPAAYFLPVRPGWAMIGFEVVIAVACVFGMLFARGRFAEAPAMALACIAGCILVGSGFGYIGVQGKLGAYSLKGFIAARAFTSLAVAFFAVHLVLMRNPKSWPLAIKGALAAVPGAALTGIAFLPQGQRILQPILNLGGFVSTAAAILGFLIATASISASVHLVVKAFSLGRLEPAAGSGSPASV